MIIITPEEIKSFKMGSFLEPEEWAKTVMKKGEEHKIWRTSFIIRDLRTGTTDDGEYVSFDLTVPSDVVSKNQGRTAQIYLGFPEDTTSMRRRISGQQLFELFTALGYQPIIDGGFKLSHIDKEALLNIKFSAQVDVGPDKEGVNRQNISYFRVPK